MKINHLGHSCFKVRCKDLNILIDPYDNSIGLKMPKVRADIVLVTHHHFDHDNVSVAGKDALIIDGPGEYEAKGVFIYGREAFHDDQEGAALGTVTMYLIEEDKIRLAHLGDLGQKKLTKDQLEFLDNVDILLIPVGGQYTINASEASNIINEIEPRIVIPMHYGFPGLKSGKKLDPVDNFVKEIGLSPEKMDELKITEKTLSANELKLVLLENN